MAGLTPVSNVAAWWCSLADWLGDLSRDVRHAARGLRRSPAFTLAVVVMLGLGSGAATAVFGVVYGLLVRPLPYSGADRIVRVGLARVGQSGVGPMYRRVFESLRGTSEAFEQVAGHAPKSLAWVGPEGSVLLRGAAVTPSLFPLLRVVLHAGRPFGAAEGRFGADRVVVLSYAAWTRRFGSDADIVGAPLSLGGAPYTVVGVLAQGFSFPGPEVEFWTPMVLGSPNRGLDRLVATFSGLGRLRRGVSSNQAAAEVDTILRRSGIFASSLEARVIPPAGGVDRGVSARVGGVVGSGRHYCWRSSPSTWRGCCWRVCSRDTRTWRYVVHSAPPQAASCAGCWSRACC